MSTWMGDTGSLGGVGFTSAIGLDMFGFGALRLPSWARRRRIQMAAVAERLTLGAKSQVARGKDVT